MPKDIIKVIIDEETGKKIKITQQMITECAEAVTQYRDSLQKTNQGIFGLILSTGKIIDKKLYLATHTNLESFADEILGLSKRHAYNFYELYIKIPPKIIKKCATALHTKLPSFRRLLAMPSDKSFFDNLSEADLQDLAQMPDSEFKKEIQGWKTRYQKQYRRADESDQKLKTLKAETDAEIKNLLTKVKELSHDLSIARTEEDDKKILKLQQELDNWKKQYQSLDEKIKERDAEELTEQQAWATCDHAFSTVLGAMLDLKKVKLCLAVLPQVYGLYTLIRDMVDAEIAYIMEKLDIEGGPTLLRDLAKDVNREEKGQSVEEYEEQEKQKRRAKIEKHGHLDSRTDHLDD